MPIYEYVCPKCEEKFELKRPMSQSSEAAPCPHCRQSSARILSAFACCSTDSSGMTSAIGGGGSCASCGASSCETCAG